MIIPIQQKKEGVLDKAFEIRDMLKSNFSVKVDDSDKSPGWKFSEQEIQGIPTRIEIGPKDIEKGQAVIVRRDTREKIVTPIEKIEETLAEVLETMQNDMYNKAKAHLKKNTHIAHNWEEFNDILENQQGFIRAMWCGEKECEEAGWSQTGICSLLYKLFSDGFTRYCRNPAAILIVTVFPSLHAALNLRNGCSANRKLLSIYTGACFKRALI